MFILLLGLFIVGGCTVYDAAEEEETNDIDIENIDEDVDLGPLYTLMQEIRYTGGPDVFAELQTQLDLQLKPYVQPYLDAGCELGSEGGFFCPENSEFYSDFEKDFRCESALRLRPEALVFELPLVNCFARLVNEEDRYNTYSWCFANYCKSFVLYDSGKFMQIKNGMELKDAVGVIDTKEKAMSYVLLTTDASRDLFVNSTKIREGNSVKNESVTDTNAFTVTVYSSDNDLVGGLGCYDTINYLKLVYTVSSSLDGFTLDVILDDSEVVYTQKLDATTCD